MYPQDTATGSAPPTPAAPTSMSNGLLTIMTAKQLEDQARAKAQAMQVQPHIQSLAAHIRRSWSAAKQAKRDVEDRMLRNLRARNGEYEPEKLNEIRKQGGSEIYMMLIATKARGAAALIRDALIGSGADKPWTLSATAIPELPPQVMEEAKQEATEAVMQLYLAGTPPTPQQLKQIVKEMKDKLLANLQREAREAVKHTEDKMEDQLQEGGFIKALTEFVNDLSIFPSAILKGPVIRRKHKLRYTGGKGRDAVTVEQVLATEWERVDPFMAYPAPHATGINDGDFIEHHRLTKESLTELIGVEGYSEEAIRAVLSDYGRGGLKEWLRIDSQRADIEEKPNTLTSGSTQGLIDALQYWGAVEGSMLREWGMSEEEVPDGAKMYWVEAWLIGSYVIKATLNTHPLGHKPYYTTSYEKIPGKFWGNSPADLIMDCQNMCNAAARALANNMGIASGPQVWVDVSRLPDGEEISQMHPWKIWQTSRDLAGGSGAPMGFFQPETHAQELMAVYERFATLADEYSGIPRYMTGAEGTPGAGRTASGLSMMITNAGKTIKMVISNIDVDVLEPMLTDLYHHNLRYSEDDDLKGDITVIARGALSLQVKDSAQVRRNEFLQFTANPIDMEIIGLPGRAAVLREVAKTLDMNVDEIVPSEAEIKQRMVMQQMMAMQQQQMAMQQPAQPGGEQLMDGAPTTDNFSPK